MQGTDGKDIEGRSCCLDLDNSWRQRAESGPGRIQTMLHLCLKLFTFLGSRGEEEEGGREGGVNKRSQLLTALLVFWPPPPTRSKEASSGEGRRGWKEEGKGEGGLRKGVRRDVWWCRRHGEAGQCLIFGLN